MKNRSWLTIFTTSLAVLASFGLLSQMQAATDEGPLLPENFSGSNTFDGFHALFHQTANTFNTAVGWQSLATQTTAEAVTGCGAGTLVFNTADNNSAFGAAALEFNVGGGLNVAVGGFSLLQNVSGSDNTAVGMQALQNNVSGLTNAALGVFAGQNTTSNFNVAVGGFALQANVGGANNTAVGAGAMESGGGGDNNTAVGELTGNGITGTANTVLGKGAGTGVTSGGNNVCIGLNAGSNIATASSNIYIGNNVNPPGPGLEFNTIRIGDNLPTGVGLSACFIGGILSNPIPQLAGQPILAFNTTTQQIGWTTDFSANRVAELKKKVEEQQASITQLKSEMQTMVAQLKDQAAQIQRVSAQLQVSKPAPQVVANKP